VFANLVTFLANAGAGLADVVRVGVLLQDPDLRADINERWLALFPDAGDRPARHTTVRDLPGQMVVQLRRQRCNEVNDVLDAGRQSSQRSFSPILIRSPKT
jgi:enamine deaminase RidA (YjgF/YER057c/UK114 family)